MKNRILKKTHQKGWPYLRLYGFIVILLWILVPVAAQESGSAIQWIRPKDAKSPAVWGIQDGIVFGLWPFDVSGGDGIGGPRGLFRMGYELKGEIQLLNFIAIEPVVNGKMEYSEISPSQVDGKWGKLMWASDKEQPGSYFPSAVTRGVITHPDPNNPGIEQLSVYVFMERFINGAHPYLKVSIRSDRPEEIGFEIFHQENSVHPERCALTATMGNYSRLRLLYLKDRVIDSRKLYKGYDEIDFIEKEGYPAGQLMKDKNGDLMVVAAPSESFEQLSSWPQDPAYLNRMGWRYRPSYKVTQYWRKEGNNIDPSLHVRVNGRAKYWSVGSRDKSHYIDIPGGPSFENFELREKYYPGQRFYFGITRRSPEQMGLKLPGL